MDKFDFSGWATRANLKCSDGRVILKDAFKHNDGQTVPLVWNHQHSDPNEVLGHALLENREDGVYAYCKFNETESGRTAKLLVQHGDVSALSIYANQLKQQGSHVLHGAIREVSLVLAGANPGAFIDSIIKHGEEYEEEAIIYTGENISLYHAETDSKEEKPKMEETKTEDKKETKPESEETLQDVFDTLNEKQKTAVYAIVGKALEEGADEEDDSEGGNEDMKHNVFDTEENQENVISHADIQAAIADAKRYGSMRESFLAHSIETTAGEEQTYGIKGADDWLFPDARNLNTPPEFIKRDMGWVSKVMRGTSHTPFSRIKSMFADITEDEARAKGYIKGKYKKEEVFSLLKRTTTPTTIYKKQKMDRDDIVDITDFDVITWLKSEMRMMLDEEIARAILVSDGRPSSSDDKINELNIRPIWTDDDLFTIKVGVSVDANATSDDKAKAMIRASVKSRKNYKGSGNPVLFTTEDWLTDCLLLEDGVGRIIYDSVDKLKSALRVSDIITVPVMEGLTRTDSEGKTRTLIGIIVNLKDYNVGADKGGAVNMFDDFDIDYNAQKYLIETRCSGALIKPFSAIALELIENSSVSG
jgi:HK97 family phage prohead protease|nr:MAG TPA: major capsid protein [Caudoviricetes sp.]